MKFVLVFCFLVFYSCTPSETKSFSDKVQKEKQQEILSADSSHYKVIAVKDGDTFKILKDSAETAVRLSHIDAPEKKQAFGNKSRQYLAELCFGKLVQLKIDPKNAKDQYKRILAEIILEDGTNVNKEMVKKGLAWHFEKYSKNSSYADLQREAQAKKIGIWSHTNPVSPWDFRKLKRDSSKAKKELSKP